MSPAKAIILSCTLQLPETWFACNFMNLTLISSIVSCLGNNGEHLEGFGWKSWNGNLDALEYKSFLFQIGCITEMHETLIFTPWKLIWFQYTQHNLACPSKQTYMKPPSHPFSFILNILNQNVVLGTKYFRPYYKKRMLRKHILVSCNRIWNIISLIVCVA